MFDRFGEIICTADKILNFESMEQIWWWWMNE